MQYYQSLQERAVFLPIGSDIPKKQVIYSIPLRNLVNGNLLQMTGTFEVTNPYQLPVMIGSNLILATTAIAVEGEALDVANATNDTKDIHHSVLVKARQYLLTKDYPGTWYLNLVAWAGAYGFDPTAQLIVEQHYGHLDVVIS